MSRPLPPGASALAALRPGHPATVARGFRRLPCALLRTSPRADALQSSLPPQGLLASQSWDAS